jgi:exodeoxyribonuclease VII large subunit
MWRPDAARLLSLPKDGEAVEVHGKISVYEVGGQYQLYSDLIRPAGEGLLFQKFQELKARLEAEGLFDADRKRSLPPWPTRIGVVTSPGAAALRDVINVLRRRFPLVEVILSPTPVQGEDAPGKIITAIEALNTLVRPDVILVVRGGGSMEDLWAFNDEGVVRAIADSKIPIVSGIGHETDLLLADYAADLRAPTPSAAAEVVTPDRGELSIEIQGYARELHRSFAESLRRRRWELEQRRTSLNAASPRAKILNARQHVDDLFQRAYASLRHNLALRRATVDGLAQTLRAVGPAAVLERGFALVERSEDGAIVRSVRQVNPKDRIKIRVRDGSFGAEVLGVEDEG